MDLEKYRKIASTDNYPGVKFGHGVILYGKVKIKAGTIIGDYCILGIPSADKRAECNSLSETIIGTNVDIGAFCVVHNGAKIGPKVRIEERCNIGWNSSVGAETRIIYGAQIHYKVKIGRNCIVGGFSCDRSIIGDNVIMLGKLVHKMPPDLIRRFRNPIYMFDGAPEEKSPKIEKKVFIGFDAIVIGGVKVQSHAYIAAKAIVTKDVPSGNIVVGKKCYTCIGWEREKKRRREKQTKN